MSELDEPSIVEMASSAGDSGVGRGPEVGESGPAGVAESAVRAVDNVLKDAGEVAAKAEAIGSGGLTEAGRLAGEAASAGAEGLEKAGGIAGTIEADAGKALSEAGNIASAVEADGAKALEGVGAAGSDTWANFLSVGWDAGAPAETGESGPGGPVEQMVQASDTESWDDVLTGGGWNAGASLETGESGPTVGSWETAVEVVGESLEVAAVEGVAEAIAESSEEWRDR